ncbi:MAG: PspA/IM30 family protein [Armatimonadetes bacterium]|nr:PspA/IM30 family protein [Armatimonadota bacterium]
MLKRFMALVRSWFGRGLDVLENPDVLLDQAKHDMQEMHARNRERAVVAITAKNNLQNQVDDLQKTVDNLQAKAEFALKRGDRELALQLLKEKQGYEQSLQSARETLATAIETAEQVKVAIKREEEQIRQKTAEALALKAKWKQAQIQSEMEKQLQGMGTWEDTNNTFTQAKNKINNKLSEAKALNEIGQTNVESRLRQLEVTETDVAAQSELEALEAKLGLAAPITQSVTAPTNEIEAELARLEQKVGGSGGSTGS